MCLVADEPLVQELWHEDLAFLDMTAGGRHPTGETVRRLEIFLDFLAAEAATTVRHLFDDTLAHVLTEEERDLRRRLQALADAPAGLQAATAWEPVRQLLEDYGFEPPTGPD